MVTVLFADIVGFTSLCERTDPEDVDRVLREYYALARGAIEAYGGGVEKYIGDAVAGVFGMPTAHEDDAERAVRAGLRLIEQLADLETPEGRLQARVGINTGPALARLDVDPHSGQGFLVGDAVNTASRLQAAAPPMRVVVGELTHDLSSRAIDFEAMGPLAAKGKAEALQAWLVRAPVARLGIELGRAFSTAFVGREVELGILRGLFERAVASSSPQFVLVNGEAGMGKSRLILELARYIDTSPGLLATWRQGRALPHGEGVSFWSLSEIVREHAGIRENDDQQTVEAKLRRVVADSLEAEWILARLRPLLGLESSPATQEENFAAWQRFIGTMGGNGPLVLVFEDLHWARPGTLALLEHLAANLSAVPALVIASARPELREDHPAFAAGDPWTVVHLHSLSDAETRRLIDHLAGGGAAEIGAVVVERCGGNPFFTEELVRLLQERVLHETTATTAAGDVARSVLPDSLHALVAARLDALHPALKSVLTDAAVVGQTFWPGALTATGEIDRLAVDRHLEELTKREFLRPSRVSTLEGENEYAFWHGLTREVAYAQLPRATRAAKHAAVAQWIETTDAGRLGDVAQILAHHYETAYDLAEAAGERELAGRLLRPTVRALWVAGDRALPLDVPMAEARYRRALDLTPEDDEDRPRLLAAWAEALVQTGRLQEAIDALEGAADALRTVGHYRAAAAVMVRLCEALHWHDDRRATEVCAEALVLLQNDEPSVELVRALEGRAGHLSGLYQIAESLGLAERAIRIASDLGLEEPERALMCRGLCRVDLGDEGGIEDLRRTLQITIERAHSMEAGLIFYDLADGLCVFKGPREASRLRRRGLEFFAKRANRLVTAWFRVQAVQHALWTDEWDGALEDADELEDELAGADDPLNLLELRWAEARLLTLRGEPHKAQPLAIWAAERGRSHPGNALNCLPSLAAVQLAVGDRDAALVTIGEVEELSRGIRGVVPYAMALSMLLRTAVQAGDPDLAARLMDGVPAKRALDFRTIAGGRALLFETDGKRERAAAAYAESAQSWHEFGAPYEEGMARLGEGRCLVALGRAPEAAPPLAEARATFMKLGAKPALTETQALLSGVNLRV